MVLSMLNFAHSVFCKIILMINRGGFSKLLKKKKKTKNNKYGNPYAHILVST